jgi:hypothetical protein
MMANKQLPMMDEFKLRRNYFQVYKDFKLKTLKYSDQETFEILKISNFQTTLNYRRGYNDLQLLNMIIANDWAGFTFWVDDPDELEPGDIESPVWISFYTLKATKMNYAALLIQRNFKKYYLKLRKEKLDPLKRELMEYYYHPSKVNFEI